MSHEPSPRRRPIMVWHGWVEETAIGRIYCDGLRAVFDGDPAYDDALIYHAASGEPIEYATRADLRRHWMHWMGRGHRRPIRHKGDGKRRG